MNILNEATRRLAAVDDLLAVDPNYEVVERDIRHVSLCTSQLEHVVRESDEEKLARTRFGRMLGRGCFGTVFACEYAHESNKKEDMQCCVKVVDVDDRYKNRELEIMCELRENSHPSIISIIDYYLVDMQKRHEENKENDGDAPKYCIVMPRYVCSMRAFISKLKWKYEVETYSHLVEKMGRGLLGALGHLHRMGIMHRDIKPENILYDSGRNIAVLGDFGSAKHVKRGRENVSEPYICSRWYRAPELILGSSSYDNAIDAWSLGCVLIEFATGHVAFREDDNTSMLCEIFKVMGVPNVDTVKAFNPMLDDAIIDVTIGSNKNKQRQNVKTKHAVKRLLYPHTHFSRTYIMYISKCIQYSPEKRVAFVSQFVD